MYIVSQLLYWLYCIDFAEIFKLWGYPFPYCFSNLYLVNRTCLEMPPRCRCVDRARC